jgi:dienelactone hydrolase
VTKQPTYYIVLYSCLSVLFALVQIYCTGTGLCATNVRRARQPKTRKIASDRPTHRPRQAPSCAAARLQAAATLWFAKQGFVVAAPQRPGHGETGGVFLEDVANCETSDFLNAGRNGAANIQSAIDYMTTQPFVLKDGVIVVGQSAGGWDILALLSQNPSMVRAGIDFEGGRGGHFGGKPNNNCHPDNLVAATREFGSTARIPLLMIYTQNDTFFGPALSKRLYEAWTAAGGNAEFHLLPPFKDDGHFLVDYPDSAPVWSPIVTQFLGQHPSVASK